ncbi:nitrite reductase small subunit NirD [Parahaliea mediterranea]|uniref:Nitrite reductase small subunit NirD n=1 Tax=Parahaliea mediterranea TaxID=651086 RepID=A0A939DFS7_9GAMM|nr:nitrite reductase small subunit NirD [Parahaliea mediterranea]MBN7796732.1 nitrite reductase small subunit NirD [Parahaliea mediterranea]
MNVVEKLVWQGVCLRADLVANSGVCALVAGEQVAIFYLPETEQQVFALGNRDPVGRANVMSRGIVGDLQGQLVVASPLYKEHYNLLTGQCLEDARVCLPVYPVRMDGDQVQVQAGN